MLGITKMTFRFAFVVELEVDESAAGLHHEDLMEVAALFARIRVV